MNFFKVYCGLIVSKAIILRASKVSLIVGSILNLINQGEFIFALDFTHLSFTKFLLTYFVPYSVTTYTAISMKLEFLLGTKSAVETDLECTICHANIHIKENELISECKNCGIKTRWRLKK